MLSAGEWIVQGNELVIKIAESQTVVRHVAQFRGETFSHRIRQRSVRSCCETESHCPAPRYRRRKTKNGAPRAAPGPGGRGRAEQDPVVRRMQEKFGAAIPHRHRLQRQTMKGIGLSKGNWEFVIPQSKRIPAWLPSSSCQLHNYELTQLKNFYGWIQSARPDVESQIAIRRPAKENAGDCRRSHLRRRHGYRQNGWPQAIAQPAHRSRGRKIAATSKCFRTWFLPRSTKPRERSIPRCNPRSAACWAASRAFLATRSGFT